MKGSQLRLLVALGNVLLIAAIAALAFSIIRGSSFSELETPNTNFDAVKFQIADTSGPRSSIQEFSVVWQALDRKVIVVAPKIAPPKPAPAPTIQTLGSRLRVVAVHDDHDDPKKSTAIVETRGNGQQQMVKYGQKLQGYTIVGIRSEGESSAILTVKGPTGKSEDIRLVK
ncbi:MAG: hypothetical protein JKY65_25305 [Planctomycetes bacterium]|nr:hypothetical protein [Planctomycetota bacterium]